MTHDKTKTKTPDILLALEQTQVWFESVVLGLNLCPYAHLPAKAGRVRFSVLNGDSEDDLLVLLTQEIERLEQTSPQTLETTVIIAPQGFEDFYYYTVVLEYVEQWLAVQGWEGFVQVASFHPDYQFAGSEPHDAANLTNRSPWPLFHLIREASLSEVIESGADTNAIPERNITRVKALTDDERKALFPYLGF